MSAGVEILLLVVPVWIWIIDWSYCRVIPKDEHTLAVNGTLLGVQIFKSFFTMMRDRKMFGEVVSFVVGAPAAHSILNCSWHSRSWSQ